MALQPVELRGIHHLGCHALVLNAVIGHDGGGDSTRDIGICEVGIAQDGHKFVKRIQTRCEQPVAHVPQRLQAAAAFISVRYLAVRGGGEPSRAQRWNAQDFKSILGRAHLLGGRNDDLQHGLSSAKKIAVEYGLFWPFMASLVRISPQVIRDWLGALEEAL